MFENVSARSEILIELLAVMVCFSLGWILGVLSSRRWKLFYFAKVGFWLGWFLRGMRKFLVGDR
jgi:hypothetical protein